MKTSSIVVWKSVCALALLLACSLAAPAQTYQQVAPQPAAPSPGGGTINLPPAEKARRQAKPATILTELKGVVFRGNAADVRLNGVRGSGPIEPGDVKFAAAPDFQAVIQPFIGRPVTLASLDQLTSAIVHYYRAHDRPIVNAFVPRQNITNGYVQVVVVEGHVDEVAATGAKWFSNEDLRHDLRLHPGDPISGDELREDLDWINRNPFHQSDVVFGPGPVPGTTDITLKTVDRFPARFYAGFDDSGNQYTGDYRYFTGFNYGDLFGLDQQLSYQYSTGEDSNQFFAHAGTWVVPLPWRHVLTIYGDYAEAHASVPGTGGDFKSGGVNWQTSLRYEVPLRDAPNFHHSLIAGYDFKQGNNNLAFGGTTVSAVYADTDQFVLGYQASYTDPYGTTSGNITGYYSPGGLTGHDTTADYEAMRTGADASYVYGQLNVDRLTKLPWDFTWHEHALVQESDANLLSSEQLGLGGYQTVRGYDEREVNGDSGFLVSSELAARPISLGNLVGIAGASDQFQLLGFIDYGGASLHHPGPADTYSHSNLLGVGPGIRYDITPYMTFRFDYGFQLLRTGFDTDRDGSRGHIGLVLSLPGGLENATESHPAPAAGGDSKDLKNLIGQPTFAGQGIDALTGFNVNAYGGVTAFQNSSATLRSPDAPAFVSPNSFNASQQSEVGGVGGLRAGYTWIDFNDMVPWLMPAIDTDFTYAGYTYKTDADGSAYSGSTLSSDLNTYSLMLEPKLKFNLGLFRPYIGFGAGGTYLHADNTQVHLQSHVAGVPDDDATFGKGLDAGAFSVAGLAGCEYFFDPHWALTLEYKYQYIDADGTVNTAIPNLAPPAHLHYSVDGLGSHFFTGGISYYF